MNTDDADPGSPSSPDDSRDGEQPPDLVPGQPQAHELELDSYGVPVQDRPAKGRAYLVAAGGLICGGVSAWLAIVNSRAKLPAGLVMLGMLFAISTTGVPWLLGKVDKRKKHGWVIWVMIWAGLILALLGFSGLYAVSCPNCGA
jgi:hypothetical protein